MPSPCNWRCTVCSVVVGPFHGALAHCPECNALGGMFRATDEPTRGIPHNPFQPHDHETSGEVLGPGAAGCMDRDRAVRRAPPLPGESIRPYENRRGEIPETRLRDV